MFNRGIYPIWTTFARSIRMGQGKLISDLGFRIWDLGMRIEICFMLCAFFLVPCALSRSLADSPRPDPLGPDSLLMHHITI